MKRLITIIAILFSVTLSAQVRNPVDTVKLISLKDLWQITQSLKDKMTVTEWEKVTKAIDNVYVPKRDEYLKSKDTAKKKDEIKLKPIGEPLKENLN